MGGLALMMQLNLDGRWGVRGVRDYRGLCADLANHLPRPGEVFEKDGYAFRVQPMRPSPSFFAARNCARTTAGRR